MRPDETLYFMYHELETPGRPLCQQEPGYVRYVLTEQSFREQMNWLLQEGIRGLSVSQALTENSSRGIVITFDDGCESDLRVAAPLLKKAGFDATFYVTLGFLGQPGYLEPQQVRELAEAGFEVGCHSMTHAYLDDLDEAACSARLLTPRRSLKTSWGVLWPTFPAPAAAGPRRLPALPSKQVIVASPPAASPLTGEALTCFAGSRRRYARHTARRISGIVPR